MVLTILYVALLFLRPENLFPESSSNHLMLGLAVLALLTSLPRLHPGCPLFRTPQTYLMLAFLAAIVCSELAGFWFGGALEAVQKFFPCAIAFLLITVHVTTMKRVHVFAAAMLMVSIVLIAQGVRAYHTGAVSSPFLFQQRLFSADEEQTGTVARLTGGGGYLQDPNDFAQYLLTLLPFLFVSWGKGRLVRNLCLAIVPSGVFLYAIYLTRSRGALLGLMVLVLFALRSKIGSISSIVLTTGLFVGLLASNFTGGRVISIEDGTDRLDAWGTGLTLFKEAPIFGVGFDRFTEHNELTAHNSFVLCLAELGIVGFTVWLTMLSTTLVDLNRVIRAGTSEKSPSPGSYPSQELAPVQPIGGEAKGWCFSDGDDATRWAKALRLSLISFLATAWFLSRTYVPTLYITIAMSVVLTSIAAQTAAKPLPRRRNPFGWAVGVEFAIILLVHLTVRMRF